MKKILIISLIAAIAVLATYFLFFKEPTFKAKNGFLNNIDETGLTIEGYDPVAYVTERKPVKGDSRFTAEYNGATFQFASAEHKTLFKNAPEKYAPQYGAFCGYAVSIGKLRPVDPTVYQIDNGRLILQHTKEAYDLFNKNLKASVVKADNNWPGLESTRVGKKVEFDKPASAPTASK